MHDTVKRAHAAALALSLSLCSTACGNEVDNPPWHEDEPDDGAELQTALTELAAQELTEMRALGVGVTVQLADGRRFEASAGRTGPEENASRYDVGETRQVFGSVTKLYTAVLIMQLVEQGKIGLDDAIDRWLSIPHADAITVRMLLNHTSGLRDYLDLLTEAEYAQRWTPIELVQVAIAAGLQAEPGGSIARYANTNFTLLALIVEAATGRSWEENVRHRITKPLGLHRTSSATQPQGRKRLVDGWVYGEDGWTATLAKVDPSIGWGVGAIAGTNRELARFTRALFAGELFARPRTLDAMREFDAAIDPALLAEGEPPYRVGLCMLRYETDGIVLEGHPGHIIGYNAATFRDPDNGAIITVTANTDHAVVGLTAIKIARYLHAR